MFEIDSFAAGRLDELQTVMDQGQRLEAEEVELDKTDFLDAAHVDTG